MMVKNLFLTNYISLKISWVSNGETKVKFNLWFCSKYTRGLSNKKSKKIYTPKFRSFSTYHHFYGERGSVFYLRHRFAIHQQRRSKYWPVVGFPFSFCTQHVIFRKECIWCNRFRPIRLRNKGIWRKQFDYTCWKIKMEDV